MRFIGAHPAVGYFLLGLRVISGCAALMMLGSAWLSAGQLDWFLVSNSGDRLSTGADLPDGYGFQVGVFAAGFTPTATNTAAWPAHWQGLTAASYVTAAGGLSSTFFVDRNGVPFTAGTQLYVFGYRPAGTGMAEVWLATDAGWRMASADPLETPVFLDLVEADTVIGGQADAAGNWIRTARVAMAEAPPLYYAQWQVAWFNLEERTNPAVSGPWADPDGDGLANALEYFTGSDPRTKGLQPLGIDRVGGNLRLACGFDASARVEWKLRHGTNLVTWTDAPVQPVPNLAGDQLELTVTPGPAGEFWRMEVSAVMVP